MIESNVSCSQFHAATTSFCVHNSKQQQQLIPSPQKQLTATCIIVIIVSHDSHVSNSPTENDQTRPLLYHQRADGATCPASGAAVEATHCEIHEREPKQERHKNESKCPKGIGTNRRPGPKRHGRPRHHRERPRRRRLGRTENDVRDAQLGRLSHLPAE